MSFVVRQISDLDLGIEGDEEQEAFTVSLNEVGDHQLYSKPQFKGDKEEWLVNFQGTARGEPVKVQVIYSQDFNGHRVESCEVTTVPNGLTVRSDPAFETQDCEDQNE